MSEKKQAARQRGGARNVFGVLHPPYPGVLRKDIKVKGLHNVAVRKCMKAKGRDFRSRRLSDDAGHNAKKLIHTK